MTARPARETLDSLGVTLQKLEQAIDPASGGQDVAELKRILLNRIAELEALEALQPVEVAPAPVPSVRLRLPPRNNRRKKPLTRQDSKTSTSIPFKLNSDSMTCALP